MLKKIFYVLIAALVIIQFIRPKQNIAAGPFTADVSTKFAINDNVASILKDACYDCHSNNTTYPWYANVQPVGWWLQHHVNEGKEEINFDEFASYSLRKQHHKLEEMAELVDKGEMPLASYTRIHKDAVLSDGQKQLLINWTKEQIAAMEAKYPKDSLEMPKRPKP